MIHIELANITKKQHDAAMAAENITTQIKKILQSKEVVTIEKLTDTEQLGAGGLVLLQQFIDALNSPVVASTTQLVDTFLGGLGANLTGIFHEGCVIVTGISKWIATFETVYHRLIKQG